MRRIGWSQSCFRDFSKLFSPAILYNSSAGGFSPGNCNALECAGAVFPASLFNDRLLILIIVNQIAAREIWQGRVRSPVRTIILWAAMRCTMMVEIVSLFKPDS